MIEIKQLTAKMKDITGVSIGSLTALKPAFKRNNNAAITWEWLCTCGNTCYLEYATAQASKRISTNPLTPSCGCVKVEVTKKTHTIHGDTNSNLYQRWYNIIKRCTQEYEPNYINYGMKGIYVCDEWKEFIPFREWSLANGYSPELEIDRINNNLGYSPENCRWTTRTINARNKGSRKGSASKYVGVCYNKDPNSKNKWVAGIGINGKRTYIGSYPTEIEAAQARDNYVKEHQLEGFTINL